MTDEPKLRTSVAERSTYIMYRHTASEYRLSQDIDTLLAENARLKTEVADLKHDIERHIAIATAEVNRDLVPPELRELSERATGGPARGMIVNDGDGTTLLNYGAFSIEGVDDHCMVELCGENALHSAAFLMAAFNFVRSLIASGDARPSATSSSSAVGESDPVGDSGLSVASPNQEK